METPLNILSLFDGMSCGQIALQRAGISVNNYYASEIDKHAIKVTMANFPNTIQLGSVANLKHIDWLNPKIDLLIGGSPCQGFSFAGKQLNFNDPRSMLFFEYVRILREIQVVNPDVKFLLENVKMKKEYQNVISEYLGVQPIEVNSSLLSAQNRKRLYWTNIQGFAMPEDRGILLKDIVHEFEYEKGKPLSNKELDYMLSSSGNWKQGEKSRLEGYLNTSDKKHPCLTANFSKGVPYNVYFEGLEKYIIPYDKALAIFEKELEKGKITLEPSTTDGVTTINPKKKNGQQTYQQDRVYVVHGKMVCLSAELSGRFNILINPDYILGCITPDRVEKRQNGQRFSDGKKFYTLTAQDKHGILIEGYIRKLTPVECERLQTVPDNYTAHVSDSQRYRMLGNGWTVDVISAFVENLKTDTEPVWDELIW